MGNNSSKSTPKDDRYEFSNRKMPYRSEMLELNKKEIEKLKKLISNSKLSKNNHDTPNPSLTEAQKLFERKEGSKIKLIFGK